MDEATYRKYDFRIKLIVLIGTSVAFIFGVLQYRESSEREFKKPYLEQQIKTCIEITELVSEVSRIKGNAERAKKADVLSTLYFSKAALFFKGDALHHFREYIDLVMSCKDKEEINECHHLNWGVYQFNIATACRNEMLNSWGDNNSGLEGGTNRYQP